MRVWFGVVACIFVTQSLRAECVVPEWKPVVVNGAICGTAMDITRSRFDDADVELRSEHGRQTQCGRPVTVTFEVGIEPCNSHVRLEGTLRLAMNVEAAHASVDGEPDGLFDSDSQDSGLVWLDEGIHEIALEAEGYRPLKFRVRIRAGQTTKHTAILRRSRR